MEGGIYNKEHISRNHEIHLKIYGNNGIIKKTIFGGLLWQFVIIICGKP